jgi:hypothetical protein
MISGKATDLSRCTPVRPCSCRAPERLQRLSEINLGACVQRLDRAQPRGSLTMPRAGPAEGMTRRSRTRVTVDERGSERASMLQPLDIRPSGGHGEAPMEMKLVFAHPIAIGPEST